MSERPFQLPPQPWNYGTSGAPSGNGHYNLYVTDASGRKICSVFGKRGEQEITAEAITRLPRLLAAEMMIRIIIFNVQQNPSRYSVEEVLWNLRKSLGLKDGERQ